MVQKVHNMHISVSIGMPLYILEILDAKVKEFKSNSRSDLVVKILQEKFKLPNQ